MNKQASCQEDISLYKKLQSGDYVAFEKIFHKFYPILSAYARKFVGQEDSEEIIQDIMLWLWESRSSHVIESSLPQYLFRAVRNRCITLINHNSKKRDVLELMHSRILDIEIPDFYILEEMMQNIDKAIASLPESYRVAFMMNRFENKTYKEIALELGISHKTVDYRVQQALKLLRIELGDYLPLILLAYILSKQATPI